MMREAGEVTYTDAHQRMVSSITFSNSVINLKKKGKNRGEVCFTNTDDLHAAKKKFDGQEINGRRIAFLIRIVVSKVI